MEVYSIPLAVEDFVPVILSAFGMYLMAGMIGRMESACKTMAFVGFVLISLGGLAKASWKLVYALSAGQTDLRMVDNSFFFLLAPGFILVAFALLYAQRTLAGKSRPGNIWLIPGALAILTVVTGLGTSITIYDPTREGRQLWFFILLGMTTIFNFVAVGLAIRQSSQQKLWIAVLLFVVNLAAVIILQGLARAVEQTEALQWIEQIVNTIAQGGFVYAVWLLSRSTDAIIKGEKNPVVIA